MRTFIHHNPLHGLEHLPFDQAVKEGKRLFHGEVYLPRSTYQSYVSEEKVDLNTLKSGISRFIEQRDKSPNIDLQKWLEHLVLSIADPISKKNELATISDIYAVLHGTEAERPMKPMMDSVSQCLQENLLNKPVYDATDILFGARISEELDELVISSCLDFFDEGQSVWSMPERQLGFFKAWRDIVSRNLPFFLRGVRIGKILEESDTPEGIIAYVLDQLEVPEEQWLEYFTSELVKLHGWVGFIRWRSSAKHYYWNQSHPGDLVDYLAIRMTLALALLHENTKCKGYCGRDKIENLCEAPLCKRAERKAMLKSSLLTDIFLVKTN